MSLSLDDLIKVCQQCDGSGNPYRKHPVGSEDYGRVTETTSRQDVCLGCHGTGREEITETGQAILKFLILLREQGRLNL